MHRFLCRYRKREIEEAVSKAEKEGYKIIVPIQRATKYMDDCMNKRVDRYVRFPTKIDSYSGYIAVLEKEDKN